MKTLPWRILVVTDAGVDAAGARSVRAGGIDEWLASLEAGVDLPASGGRGARRLPLASRGDFAPARVAGALGGALSAAELDQVLHHPAFQRLESAWRGLELLLEHAGDAVLVEVVSLPRARVVDRFRDVVARPEVDRADPLTLIVLDLDFSHAPPDLAALTALAEMAEGLQAPLVAAASAGFFGFRYLIQAIALPDLPARLADSAHVPWMQFQASDPARWALLTINRYLQRAPHTAESGGHAETVSESNPDTYLWGRGVWLVAASVARSIRTHGHALDISGAQSGGFSGRPTRAFVSGAANAPVALATEVVISEQSLLELHRAAFTPVVGPLRTSAVLMPMVVTAHRLKPGKLTLEGTLAYQLTAARLSQVCGRLLESMPAGGGDEVAGFLKRELLEALGTMAAGADDAVTIEVRDTASGAEGPVAAVSVRPRVTLESKPLEFEFLLPLGRI